MHLQRIVTGMGYDPPQFARSFGQLQGEIMKQWIAVSTLMASSMLAGCVSGPKPNLVNGNYFMFGDASCVSGSATSDGRLMCFDKSGNITGYRNAMTGADMQAYQTQRVIDERDRAELVAHLQQNSQQFRGQAPQLREQSPSYDPACQPGGQETACR